MTRRTPPRFPGVGVIGLGTGRETVAARCAVCGQRFDSGAPTDLRSALARHAEAVHPAGVPGLHDPMRLVPLGALAPVVVAA